MSEAKDRPWMEIGPERLVAHVRVPAGQHVNLATIRDMFISLNLTHGFDAQAVRALSVPDAEERIIEVARGQPAPVAVDRELHLNNTVKLPMPVETGQSIGWLSGEGPFYGRTVDGQPLLPMFPSSFGHGIILHEDGSVRCACAGTLKKTTTGLYSISTEQPVEALTQAHVTVDSDKQHVWLDIPAWHYVPSHLIQNILIKEKVVRGIKHETLIAAHVASPKRRHVEIACGVPPDHGRDGHVDILIDEHIHLLVEENGRVDYREHGRIEEVIGGTAIGRVMPPTVGTHGVDVLGAFIPARPGRILDPQSVIGEGTEIHSEQPDLIRAVATGHFHRDRNGRLCVQCRYTVEENVDYHHGNINTTLPVLIKGDIRAGFTVKSAGDIEVMGVIEDARTTAQGHLIVRGGILPGAQRVKAHGDIDAKHVASRQLKCKNLRVTNSLRWSHVMAVEDVVAKEILCGNIIAGGNIVCDVLGNKDGLHTRIQVGLDPYQADLFLCAHREYDALVQHVRDQKLFCKTIGLKHQAKKISDSEWQKALADFSTACQRLATCEALLTREETQKERRQNMPCLATITVNGMAYKGTEIWLSDRAHIVLEKDLGRPRFYEKDNTVAW